MVDHSFCPRRRKVVSTIYLIGMLAVVSVFSSTTRAYGQTGARISLPLCNESSLPSNFERTYWDHSKNEWAKGPSCASVNCALWEGYPISRKGPWFSAIMPEVNPTHRYLDTLDWGDNNVLPRVDHTVCYAGGGWAVIWPTSVNNTYYDFTLARTHGYFTNTEESLVYGEVSFTQYGNDPNAPFILALQVLQGSSWVDINTATVYAACDQRVTPRSCNTIGGISGYVAPNSDVRFELRTDPNHGYGLSQYVQLWSVTLFGAECFPDASNPDMCLH